MLSNRGGVFRDLAVGSVLGLVIFGGVYANIRLAEKLSISGGELRVIFGHFIRNENQYQDCREKGSFMKANEIVLGNIEISE